MRIPLTWLAEYADVAPGTSAADVASALWRVGLEEEGVRGGTLTGPIVVGRVLELVDEPQKNGKTIRWCQVDVGAHSPDGAPRGIVCGASNFAVGDLVVVALPGAVLPGGFEISARKTYGHVSDGMICSARELDLGDDHTGILVLATIGFGPDEGAVPGADAVALLGLSEEVLEINVTPDRGYCFSLRGVAREYAQATGGDFRDPAGVSLPEVGVSGAEVRIDDVGPVRGRVGCDRYVARVVRGVDASRPSPYWVQRRLRQAGMRPISLAVDATNYVMLATGQPLHAFDLQTLGGPIIVRRATAGERLTTLDDVERALDVEDLVITDGGSQVLGIAGVMGGATSEVSASTEDVLVEAAHFDPVSVARSARRHKLSTEASRRFERGVDLELAPYAAELVVRLLVEHGGGVADQAVTDVGQREPVPSITMPADLPARLVGADYQPAQVVGALQAVGAEVRTVDPDAGLFEVDPPSWRPDLRLPVDLVEEVARLVGYDQIPSVLPVAPPGRGLSKAQRARRSVSRTLAERGGVEVLSYPFVSPSVHDDFGLPADDARRVAVRLANPLSDEQPELRTSLLASLLPVLRRNVSRGNRDVGLFELGSVTRPAAADLGTAPMPPVDRRPSAEELAAVEAAVPAQPTRVALALAGDRELHGWWGPGRAADWSDAVAMATAVAGALSVGLEVVADAAHPPWHPGRCARLTLPVGTLVGHAGELHPQVVEALELPPRTCAAELDLDVLVAAAPEVVPAQPLSTYPLALQDVALVVPAATPAAAVRAALMAGGGDLVESVDLFDVYVGPQVPTGHKSLAYRLGLRAPDRTLTAEEAAAAREAAVAEATRRTGAQLRSG
jgi:phenylalanyl-tRNA synthetase beta chain